MHVINYTRSEFLLPWRLRRQAALHRFILAIPYALYRGVIPSLSVINETLRAGKAGGGMGTGLYWQPFEISAEEYRAVIAAWRAMNPQQALYPRGASAFIEDPDILTIETQQEYLFRSRVKYPRNRPPADAAKRPLGSILIGLMCSTGILMLISALPVGIVLTLLTRYGVHADRVEAALVGGLMTAATAILGGALLGLGMFITSRRWRKRGSV
jgi:hypothetical protein